jgi:hypothetical protein
MAMTMSSLSSLVMAGGLRSRDPRETHVFWAVNTVFWCVYGTLLMLPWLGRYSISLMLPNKVVIAGTGLLVSAALRLAYRKAMERGRSRLSLVAATVAGSLLGAIVWSGVIALWSGTDPRDQLVHVGLLGSGVPMLGGAAYHAMVLMLWSVSYIGLSPSLVAPESVDAETRSDLTLRDGRRTHVVALSAIDWIQADGDYVRVHMGERSLLVRDTMNRLASVLNGNLVRIHRSTIVNVGRVAETVALPNRDVEVTLRNGIRLRASRTYADRLRAAITTDLSGPHGV